MKMVKNNKIIVKPYKRRIKGKVFKVKTHKRKNRKLGKKIKYKEVGKFLVAHDELGNFRGSKVVVPKGSKRKRSFQTKRQIDSAYFSGKIGYRDWISEHKSIK